MFEQKIPDNRLERMEGWLGNYTDPNVFDGTGKALTFSRVSVGETELTNKMRVVL